VVRPNGTMQILLWGLDIGDGSIEHLNPLASLVITTNTPNGSGGITYGGAKPIITDARIEYAGSGNLVVVAETNLGVYLYSYGITTENQIVLRDVEFVGPGSDARVQVLHSSLVVTAHRDGTGKATLKTWRLDVATGKLANPLATYVGPAVAADEIELSGRPGLTSHLHLVLGFRAVGGSRNVRSFDVVRETGSITMKDSVNLAGAGSRYALANVSGFGTSRDVYALAFRDAMGRLAVETYDYAPDGSIARRGQTFDAQNAPMAVSAPIRISSYREGGVMIATQSNPDVAQQRLDVYALDASGASTITPNRVTSQTVAENGLSGMCRVSTNAAEGEFLLATGKAGVEGIRLRAFRSGPRQ
jgi:hypothetical protein